jgi:RNA polymerase sigma-70 factor, ECF subfamily
VLGFLAQDFDRGIARMGKDVADEVLVARAQRGDKDAFGLLVRKYQYRVTKLVARYVSDSEAVDVAQEAFIKAYRALGGFRGNSAFYTWLYRIAINTAKNHLVARARRPANQDIDVADAELYGHTERLSHSDTPEAVLLGEEVQNIVLGAIQALPSDLRTAILLREIEGLSYEEIAEAMDCPIGTVRSRIFRARAAIEETLRPLSNG